MYREKPKRYKVVISKDALYDIATTKKYILDTFKYRQYADNFSKKIKQTIKSLDTFPKGYKKTGYTIEGRTIYFRPFESYLIFFTVDNSKIIVIRVLKDRMHWQEILSRIQK